MSGDLLLSRSKNTGVKSLESEWVRVSLKQLSHCLKSTVSSSYILFRELPTADKNITFQYNLEKQKTTLDLKHVSVKHEMSAYCIKYVARSSLPCSVHCLVITGCALDWP